MFSAEDPIWKKWLAFAERHDCIVDELNVVVPGARCCRLWMKLRGPRKRRFGAVFACCRADIHGFSMDFHGFGARSGGSRAHFAAASPASRRRGLLKRRSMPRPEGLSCLAPRKNLPSFSTAIVQP